MLFNSATFAIFLPIVLIVYWGLRTPKRQNVFLLAASLVFYGWWDWRFVFLLLASTITDYLCALGIERSRARGGTGRLPLYVSLAVNLGALGFFKYWDFFIGSATPIWEALGWNPGLLHVILPVGISFYTFQTLSYTVDVYRGEFKARRSLIDVAAYVSFFPQLVAGPIERASRLLPQLEKPRSLTATQLRMGLMLIVVGLIKKIVIADGMAPIAEWTYGQVALGKHVGGGDLCVGTYAFAFQVYGDFAGYSNIARGVAKLLGVELMINFRQPFFCSSIGAMWGKGWHLSFSTWLRDYLYFPLGGNRGGTLKSIRNVTVTMFLGGLWHGANWTFVLWGGFWGVYLVVERMVKQLKIPWPKGALAKVPLILVAFHAFSFSCVLFRADSLATSLKIYRAIATDPSTPTLAPALMLLAAMLMIFLVDVPHLLHPEEELPAATHKPWLYATLAAAAAGFVLVPKYATIAFIYFQF